MTDVCYSRGMFRRAALRIFCVLALGLAMFDCVSDSLACDSSDAGTACHTCACGTHVVPPATLEVVKVPLKPVHITYVASSYSLLVPTSIFHPPCLTA